MLMVQPEMSLEEWTAYVGRQAAHLPRSGRYEVGTVTRVSERYVFVQFGQTPWACEPRNLKLVAKGQVCWCGSPVGPRKPGDRNNLGCLADDTHNWKDGDRRHDAEERQR